MRYPDSTKKHKYLSAALVWSIIWTCLFKKTYHKWFVRYSVITIFSPWKYLQFCFTVSQQDTVLKQQKKRHTQRNPKLVVIFYLKTLWNIKKVLLQLINSFWNETGHARSRWWYEKGSLTFTKLIFKHHQYTQRTGSYSHLLHCNLRSASVNIFGIQIFKKYQET